MPQDARAFAHPVDDVVRRSVVVGRKVERPVDESFDVVVVGSGAGGSVTAAILAESGLRVVVLEEGPFFSPADLRSFLPSQSVRRVFREAGMSVALGLGQTPTISLTLGRAVGGSSLLTGGVCFRVPESVHATWVRDLGLSSLSAGAFERAYEDVEKHLEVTTIPASARSRSTALYVEGARRMGIEMESIRRNTGHDCEGNGLCTFGCPKSAKRSVDISYLPRATRSGAIVYSDALVESLDLSRGFATGVRGRFLGGPGGAPGVKFRFRAKVVVAACGTLHTPLLLARAGVGKKSGVLGRGITLHPAVRIVSRFDEHVGGWDGALQSVHADHDEGIKLVGVYTAVNFLAGGLPGVGPDLRERARALDRSAVFGAMIHDDGGGTIHRGPGREGVLTYRMAPRDLARLKRAMGLLCEISLEAGAKEVYVPVFGVPPVKSRTEARALEQSSIDARSIECMAFHPLGSARVAREARGGVVDERGETFDAQNLFVADGSVLPTSIGVNSQVPIMSMATRIAWGIADRFGELARRAP